MPPPPPPWCCSCPPPPPPPCPRGEDEEEWLRPPPPPPGCPPGLHMLFLPPATEEFVLLEGTEGAAVVMELLAAEAALLLLLLLLFLLVFGCTTVVTPAGFVFRRTFLVFGSLLSFLYFIRRFWNQILICRSERGREIGGVRRNVHNESYAVKQCLPMVISKREISFHEVVVAGRKDPAVCSSNLEAPRRKTIRVFTTPQGAAISQLAKKDRQKKKNAKRKKTIMLLLSILLFQPEIRSETPNLNRTAYMGRTKRRSRQKLSVNTLFCMLALCFWKYLQTTFDFLLKNIICRNACIALNKVKCGQSLRGTCVPLFFVHSSYQWKNNDFPHRHIVCRCHSLCLQFILAAINI